MLGRSAGEYDSHRIYGDIDTIPSDIDLVFNMFPAKATPDILPKIAARGAKIAVVFTSGFAEQGGSAADAQKKLVSECRAHGMRLVGPNCPGYFYVPGNVNLTSETNLKAGPVALISKAATSA